MAAVAKGRGTAGGDVYRQLMPRDHSFGQYNYCTTHSDSAQAPPPTPG